MFSFPKYCCEKVFLGIFINRELPETTRASPHKTRITFRIPDAQNFKKSPVINLYLLTCFVGKFGDELNNSSFRNLEMQKKRSAFSEAPSKSK